MARKKDNRTMIGKISTILVIMYLGYIFFSVIHSSKYGTHLDLGYKIAQEYPRSHELKRLKLNDQSSSDPRTLFKIYFYQNYVPSETTDTIDVSIFKNATLR